MSRSVVAKRNMITPPGSQSFNPPSEDFPSSRTRWRPRIAAGFALVGVAVVAYWPSLSGGFVWDDLVLVAKNSLATGELNLGSIWWRTDFSLSVVVTWLEWLAFRETATGYRIVNLLLHCISALLLWRLLGKLQPAFQTKPAKATDTKHAAKPVSRRVVESFEISGAWLGAALFAVHPVATASVAWISELKNTL
jgi:hypothetical protein